MVGSRGVREPPPDRPDHAHYGRVGRDRHRLDPASDTLLLGECKWTTSPVGPDLLADLEALEPAVRWRGSDRTVVYALFSRAGFTDALSSLADERAEVSLYTPRDLDEAFRSL